MRLLVGAQEDLAAVKSDLGATKKKPRETAGLELMG